MAVVYTAIHFVLDHFIMATLYNLPEEVIQIILKCNDSYRQDVQNVSSTCTHFHQMLRTNRFWRRMLNERFASLKKLCAEEEHKGFLDYKELFEASVACRKALRQFVIEMSEENYSISSAEFLQTHINSYHHTPNGTDLLGPCTHSMHLTVDEEKLNLLVQCFTNETTHHLKYYLLMNEIKSLHEQSQSELRIDLTHIYYGKELLPYVKHHYLKTVSQNFINCPAEHQVFEKSSHEEETYPLKPIKRKASMKYAVGMIVKFSPDVTGVIIGWLMRDYNPRVQYAGQIRAYIVLCEDNRIFSISGIHLEKVKTPQPLKNDVLGRYFSAFNGTHYIPNETVKRLYPDDLLYLTNQL